MISNSAIIEKGAVIGKDVQIGHNVFISSKAKIGNGTKIAHGAMIYGDTEIGENNDIFSYSVLGSAPQDLKYNGEEVKLIIGDSNKIREFTLINPGTVQDKGYTKIGNGNLFMGYVHVAHDCVIADNCIFANAATLAGHVEIGNFVVVGGMTPVHQFVKIGDYAMIAGASALSQDIPPFCLAEGNRAKLRGLNLTGLRRKIEEKEDIDAIRRAYKLLFESQNPLKESAENLTNESDNPYVEQLCKFVINSKRGIPYERKM